jgi:hypothetical protein
MIGFVLIRFCVNITALSTKQESKMPAKQGTIEKIFVKALPQEDKYGNKFRYAIKLEGDDSWYGVGTGKYDSLYVGSVGRTLNEGDEVEFMYQQSGDFLNVNKKTIQLISGGSGKPSSSRGSKKAAPAGSYAANQIGMAVGAAVNQAVHLHAATVKKASDIDLAAIEDLAIQLHTLAERLKKNVEQGNIAADRIQESDKQMQQGTDLDLDDDIPF